MVFVATELGCYQELECMWIVKVGHISFVTFSICVGIKQYFSFFYILPWSTNLHKLSNFSSIFSVGLLKAMYGARDLSVAWSAEETIISPKQCPQYFGSRTTNTSEAHVAPITSTH